MEPVVIEQEHDIVVKTITGVELQIQTRPYTRADHGREVQLLTYKPDDSPPFERPDPWITTSRDIDDYPLSVQRLLEGPTAIRVLEIGAGLGGFISAYVAREPIQRPIAIDPADYHTALELVRYASDTLAIPPFARQRLKTIKQRIETILDPSKVDLISGTLEEAIAKRPELLGTVDTIIDHFGARYYTNRIITNEHIKALLKHGGRVIPELAYGDDQPVLTF